MCEAVKLLIQKGLWINGHNEHIMLTDIDKVNDAYFTNIVKYALTKHEFKDEFSLEMFEPISKARLKLQNERKNNEKHNIKSKKVDDRKKAIKERPTKRTNTKHTGGTDRVFKSTDRRGENRCSVRHERVQSKLSRNVRTRNGSGSNRPATTSKQGVWQRPNKQVRSRKTN